MKEKNKSNELSELKNSISREIKIIREIINLTRSSSGRSAQEAKMISSQIKSLKDNLEKTINQVSDFLDDMTIIKPLPSAQNSFSVEIENKQLPQEILFPKIIRPKAIVDNIHRGKAKRHKLLGFDMEDLERKTLKRLKKKGKKIEIIKEKKASKYVAVANKLFGGLGKKLSDKDFFMNIGQDLIKANMGYVPGSYISVMLFSTLIFLFVAILLVIFLLFFSIGIDFTFITMATESIGARLLKFFWIIFLLPLITFFGMYFYPNAEKAYLGNKIDQELTFATIHMSAISQSMLEPSKIFEILIATKEYPFLEREFIKLINQVNIYGYDVVTSLRTVASNTPSSRFAELLNGIATTIDSGGSLSDFFDKRANTLLFEYKIEREKYTKSAETFMDIYISVVIAAPMIIMLLLIMMSISGLGVALSSSGITLVMVLGVTMINALFLTFLHLKQTSSG